MFQVAEIQDNYMTARVDETEAGSREAREVVALRK